MYTSLYFVCCQHLKSLMYIIHTGFPVEGRYPRGQLLAHDKNHDLGRQEHVSSHITWTFARGRVRIDLKSVSFFFRMLFKKCKEHMNHLKWKECTTNANGIAYHMLLYIYMRMGGATPIVNSCQFHWQGHPKSPTKPHSGKLWKHKLLFSCSFYVFRISILESRGICDDWYSSDQM